MHQGSITTIRTSRLTLVPLEVSDAAEMVDVLGDPQLYEFTGGEVPDLETLENRYRAQVTGPSDQHEIWCNWIARRIEDRQPVGFVQATVTGTAAEVAWTVGVAYQSQGFAVEATRAMCEWLAGNEIVVVTAHVHPRHIASQKVAQAVGLAQTGDTDDDGESIWAASMVPS